MKQVKVVENGVEAKQAIDQFLTQGYTRDNVYVLAHDKERSEDLGDALDANEIGVDEQGVLDSIANVFRTRGDELRSKMESIGITPFEAEQFEKRLDEGRVVVVASN